MRGALAAATSPDDLWKDMDWWKDLWPSQHEIAMVLGAAGLVTVLAVLWAVFIRKRATGAGRYLQNANRPARQNDPDSDSRSDKRRRRKRRHRRRNPTLAETGGLPPIRTEALPDDPP